MTDAVSRRTFFSAVAAGAAAFPGYAIPPQDGARAGPAGDVTAETLAAAEAVLGVAFTPTERRLMLRDVRRGRDGARRRPTPPLGADDAPATFFRPLVDAPRAATAASTRPATPPPAATAPGDGPAFASLAELGALLRSGGTTSVRLAETFLARLAQVDDRLKCVVTLCEARALEQARRADAELAAGKDRGPLHGIPFGLKDLFDTRGVRTTYGAAPFKDRVPDRDADVVRLLEDAGAVLVAKLSLGELAMGDVWFGGVTRNPWNPVEGSSGSSAGPAAAVAAGAVPFAIGTETLGSIVSPSMRCGTVGLRPTFGAVPLGGAMPLCWSLDKAGPLTRSAADAWLVYRALAPAAAEAPAAAPPDASGLVIGHVPALFEGRGEARALDRAALDAVRDLGAEVVALPPPPDAPLEPLMTILAAEAAAAFEELTLSNRDDELAQQDADAWPNAFRAARFLSAVDMVQADRLRGRIARAYAAWFRGVDVVVGPSFAGPLLVATNFTGHPCLVVRAGFVRRAPRDLRERPLAGESFDAPHGVTLWAAPGREFDLCRVGAALEARLRVAGRRPPGF